MENIIQRINKSSLKLLEPLTPEETYKRIVTEAVNLVKGKEGKLSVMKFRKLVAVYSTEKNKDALVVRKNGYTYDCFRKKKSFVVYEEDFKVNHPRDSDQGFKSAIFIPLYYKRKSFGVLLIKSKEFQKFTDKELEILRLFGSIASLTLRKTELLNETKKHLELKDKFIALAAHELRTPLTSMSGFIQLLHRRLSKNKGVEAEWTNFLLQESNRLKTLIQEILDINRINAGRVQYNYEECNVQDMIQKSIELLKLTYPHTLVICDFATQENIVVGDKEKLVKVFYNVLENAAKFSTTSNEIEVRLRNTQAYSIIIIKDKGIGIEEKDLSYIYEGFYKGKGNEQEGMGLGLYFTKNIIHGHKGTISVTSKRNIGTTVKIKLPLIEL